MFSEGDILESACLSVRVSVRLCVRVSVCVKLILSVKALAEENVDYQ